MGMKYNEVVANRNILVNIPLAFEGRRLPKETAASVMLLRVAYQQKVDEFVKTLDEVKKGLKKDGFDERARAVAEMEDVDKRKKASEEWVGEGERPAMPTDEELKKAEETRATLEDFGKEKKELEEALSEANRKKLEEDAGKMGKLTKDELADLYELLGSEGVFNFVLPGSDVPMAVGREELLAWVAVNLVG